MRATARITSLIAGVFGALAGLWNSTNNLLTFGNFLFEMGIPIFAAVCVMFGLFSLLALIASISVPFSTRRTYVLLAISTVECFYPA